MIVRSRLIQNLSEFYVQRHSVQDLKVLKWFISLLQPNWIFTKPSVVQYSVKL